MGEEFGVGETSSSSGSKCLRTFAPHLGERTSLTASKQTPCLSPTVRHESLVDPQAEEPLRQLCRALNDAGIAVCEAKLQRLAGGDVPTPLAPQAPKVPKVIVSAARDVPLLATFEAYSAAQGMSSGVREDWRRSIKQLIDFLGHDNAAALTADRLRDWRDQLLTTPSRKGTLRDSVTVRDKYIIPVRATLAWAVEEQHLTANVGTGVTGRGGGRCWSRAGWPSGTGDAKGPEDRLPRLMPPFVPSPATPIAIGAMVQRKWPRRGSTVAKTLAALTWH